MYGEPPAIVEAVFSNGSSIRAYIGEGLSVFALLLDKDGQPARNAKAAKALEIPTIDVLPQISPIKEQEKVLERRTVDQNKFTRLSSRNFRNQLYYFNDSFPTFKKFVEATWEGLQVKPVERSVTNDGTFLQFFVRDNGFEAELGWMGHGLQMWVQAMWFISQCPKDSIVVLDEPDVYMHADLQKRLIRLVTPLFSQVIVATHSIEIMEEVLPECIIPINCQKKSIKPVGNHSLVQRLVDGMGSSFNLDLARLFVSHRFMIWEGQDSDRQLLSAFQSVIFPHDLHLISSFPKVYVDGWGGWQRAIGIAELFNKNHVNVVCYCLFDSDYHLNNEIQDRQADAAERHINLHIWERKEIENYAINENAIFRYIQKYKRKGVLTIEVLHNKMFELAENMKEDIQDSFASEIQQLDKKKDLKRARKEANDILKTRWKEPFNVVSGKAFIKQLATWSQKEFGVGFQAMNIIREFEPSEIPEEIKHVISIIRDGASMSIKA